MLAELIIILALLFGLVVYAIVLVFLALPFRLPFVKSRDEKVEAMLELLGDIRGLRVIDLGSGDGKVVAALARAGANAHGIELNPLLAIWSRTKLRLKRGLPKATIFWGNFLKRDMGDYDAYVIYGIPAILGELEEKLSREMKPGSRIVMHRFGFPNWMPHMASGDVYLYIKE